ncbi:tyrosine-protein phosphatase [Kitasatospora sp. NPDC059571]|uniref:tyrosine-protein phosphatase n=1 Tax=Kitasatospora sp. NPDC059571 TaxID=3346871 RepID=UPI0036793C05
MTEDRRLVWDGCLNVRELGGLPTVDGGRTRRGAVVRADNLDRLTAEGWEAVRAYGIRTVVDLRNEEEYRPLLGRPDGIGLVRVPLDELAGPDWWSRFGGLDGTPLAFRPYLDHCPQAVAAVVAAVAAAPPGGVAVHCGAGRDRTGLAVLVLLALAGATPDAIVDDYLLSADNLRPLWAMLGRPDETEAVEAVLAEAGTTAGTAIRETLAEFDPAAYLPAADAAAVRARLVGAH